MMNLIKYFFIILLSFVFTSGIAQDDFQSKYQMGKNLINQGKYAPAMEVLKPLTSDNPDNKYIRYAHYYYALAGFKGGFLQDAYNMLFQLTNRYADWEKIDEAYYLMANIAFEQKKYRQALKNLEGRKKEMKDDIDLMKINYLSKAEPLDSLVNIQRDFPEDPVIAKALAKRLNTASALNEKQKMLFEYLVQEFKLDKKEFSLDRKSVIKASYNVAVIFPFLLKEMDATSSSRNNQYVFDLYIGMKVAVDSLKKQGVNINLLAYDSERSETKVNEILNSPEMKTMDLIIGPIYPQHYSLVNEFGLKNQILVVNPLSENSILLEGNPFVYLFQPTLRDQAGEAAEFASKNFIREVLPPKNKKPQPVNKELTKHVLIFQSPTAKDSLAASYYKDSIILKGFEVKNHEVISRETMNKLQEILKDSIKLTKVSHIFVSSNDQVLAANMISAMEVSGQSIPIITSSDWLQFPLLTYDQYERREVHFLFPDFIDNANEHVRNFKKGYLDKYNSLPLTTHAYQGYDLLRFYGAMLGKYGNYFSPELSKQGFLPGYTLSGFNYSNGRSNSFVPIVKFTETSLTPLNFNK